MSNLTHTSPGEMSMSEEELQLIKDTIAKGATDNELKLFITRCRKMGLDPLKPGHIHFVKYGNSPGTIIIGVDGFRSRAAATGKHAGTKRGIIRDAKGKCIGAWCEVYRFDWQHPAREEVSLAEYNTGKGNWVRMPETMIKKVAETAAIRMAFPDELGGVYSDEEMNQTETQQPSEIKDVTPKPEQYPPPINTVKEFRRIEAKHDICPEQAESDVAKIKSRTRPTYHQYVMPFPAKFKDKKMVDIPTSDLDRVVEKLHVKAREEGREIADPQVLEFLGLYQQYRDSMSLPEVDYGEDIPF